jgi:hypothetical protein
MRWTTIVGTALLCFVASASGQEQDKYSGRFDQNGRRLEERAQLLRAEPGYEKECKSIAEWAELVNSARSLKFRHLAAATLQQIGERNRNYSNKQLALSTTEADELRKTCLKLIAAEDAAVRQRIVYALTPIADQSCVPTFNKLLQDPDSQVCYDSLKVLKRIGDDSSVQAIVAFIADIPGKRNGSYYEHAIKTLTAIGSPAARTALDEMYKDGKDPRIKELAGAALDELDLKK